ncbi:MAG: hypothetical protein M4579_003156 [Chaenotheca gracillima]|nr:MAG: hypothetical protein M4579_003156 [Chaenotheca gracillima]
MSAPNKPATPRPSTPTRQRKAHLSASGIESVAHEDPRLNRVGGEDPVGAVVELLVVADPAVRLVVEGD